MSFITFTNPPILSLTPLQVTEFADPLATLMPLMEQIYQNPDKIHYDPYKQFSVMYPNVPVYYIDNPDLNSDATSKRQIYEEAWQKFKTWVRDYPKIFKYIKKDGKSFRLVKTLAEGKNASHDINETKAKSEWIFENLFDESDIANTVEKFRNRTGINIWDVLSKEYVDNFRDFIYHQIKRKLAKHIYDN